MSVERSKLSVERSGAAGGVERSGAAGGAVFLSYAREDTDAARRISDALRGFGVEFPTRLYAAFELQATRPCQYKGVELLGFQGRLLTNVDLPDGFALGRAVSHGYGWLCREEAQASERRDCDDFDPAPDRPGL